MRSRGRRECFCECADFICERSANGAGALDSEPPVRHEATRAGIADSRSRISISLTGADGNICAGTAGRWPLVRDAFTNSDAGYAAADSDALATCNRERTGFSYAPDRLAAPSHAERIADGQSIPDADRRTNVGTGQDRDPGRPDRRERQ